MAGPGLLDTFAHGWRGLRAAGPRRLAVTGVLLVAALWGLLLPSVTMARQAAAPRPAPNLSGLKGRSAALPGFVLKKTTATPKGVVESWERTADGARLRIEVIRGANARSAEARLNAVNAKIGKTPLEQEELMYRFEARGQDIGWANYRGTHHVTFKTYRYWKLQKGTLVMADLTFPRGKPVTPGEKPDFDAARNAFIAVRRAADSTLKALGLA